jgi:hypothetical protein
MSNTLKSLRARIVIVLFWSTAKALESMSGGKSLRQPDSAESLCESRSAETKSAAATLCRRLRKGVEGALFRLVRSLSLMALNSR